MRYVRVIAVGAAVALMATACGGSSGPTKDAFVTSVDDTCHTLDRALLALDEPSSIDAVSAYADKASRAYETALVALKKLAIPSDKAAVTDAKDLLANMDQQVTLLDAISTSAKGGDSATVTAKVSELDKLMKDTGNIAESLGAKRCNIDPLLATVVTTSTTTTSTEPASTVPVTTVPETTPLTLVPPTTAQQTGPATTIGSSDTEKKILPLAAAMSKNAKYKYADAPESITKNFVTVLNVVPETSQSAGKVGGVEVSDMNGTKFSRVFLFVPTDPLGNDAMKSMTKTLVGTSPSEVAVIGTLHGTIYHSTNSGYFFIAGNPVAAPQVVVWAVAQDKAGLKIAVAAFVSNVPA
jgi:hypothetical protein